ncbi:MAG: cytochrome c [Myxococcales bacterium]|nr:cytochrome c [Myxococcales bacterium]
MRLAIAVLLGAGALGASACKAGPDEPGYVFAPGMVRAVPYEAFEKNPVTGEMLRPPAGAVPYGAAPTHVAPGQAGAEKAGRELVSPVAASPAALLRGEKLYGTFCAVCHGPAGQGDGNIPQFKGWPLLGKPAADYPDGRLFQVITLGGQGWEGRKMPGYAAQIAPVDRWRLVQYVRRLQAAAAPAASAAPATSGAPSAATPSASPSPSAAPSAIKEAP